jgi:hypothetical protein
MLRSRIRGMLKLLEQLPLLGKYIIGPLLDGAHIVIDSTQGGANLVVDGVQVLVIRGAVNGLQLILGL